MKRITLLLLLACTFAPILNVQAKNVSIYQKKENAVKSPKIGFYVYVQKCGEVSELKTESIEQVYLFVNLYYSDFCADLDYILQKSPYYRENCYQREIYVEKMRITKNGKYKRIKNFKNYLK